ncbi:hypothetical protein ES705_34980 [subsurface metagenome]
MNVKVNCPIAGCGTLVQVQSLPKHLEQVHELAGEVLLRLHPGSPYLHQPGLIPHVDEVIALPASDEPETEPEKEPETEPEE